MNTLEQVVIKIDRLTEISYRALEELLRIAEIEGFIIPIVGTKIEWEKFRETTDGRYHALLDRFYLMEYPE